MGAAQCELSGCGVIAIGRCASCRRAYCHSHQGILHGQLYQATCAQCLARTLTVQSNARAAAARAAEERRTKFYGELADVVGALVASGVPPGLEPRRKWDGRSLMVKKPFRKRQRLLVDIEPAWPIGDITWHTPAGVGLTFKNRLRTGVTTEGHIVVMGRSSPKAPKGSSGEQFEVFTLRATDNGRPYADRDEARQRLVEVARAAGVRVSGVTD